MFHKKELPSRLVLGKTTRGRTKETMRLSHAKWHVVAGLLLAEQQSPEQNIWLGDIVLSLKCVSN